MSSSGYPAGHLAVGPRRTRRRSALDGPARPVLRLAALAEGDLREAVGGHLVGAEVGRVQLDRSAGLVGGGGADGRAGASQLILGPNGVVNAERSSASPCQAPRKGSDSRYGSCGPPGRSARRLPTCRPSPLTANSSSLPPDRLRIRAVPISSPADERLLRGAAEAWRLSLEVQVQVVFGAPFPVRGKDPAQAAVSVGPPPRPRRPRREERNAEIGVDFHQSDEDRDGKHQAQDVAGHTLRAAASDLPAADSRDPGPDDPPVLTSCYRCRASVAVESSLSRGSALVVRRSDGASNRSDQPPLGQRLLDDRGGAEQSCHGSRTSFPSS